MPLINAGQRVTADLLNELIPQVVVKGSDQAYTNITLANDDELFLVVEANSTYLFQCYLDYEGGTQGATDMTIGWTVPSGATLRYQHIGINTSGVADTGVTSQASSNPNFGTRGTGNLCGATFVGSLVVGSTGGTIQLKASKNSNGTGDTIIHAQSYLSLQLVG